MTGPHASAETTDWLERLFHAIDARDTERFLEYLDEEATFRFGSAEPVAGKRAIRDAVNGFFATIAGSRHRLTVTLNHAPWLVCEGEVTYRRHDGSEITLPFANVFDIRGDRIHRYSIYADLRPLYAG